MLPRSSAARIEKRRVAQGVDVLRGALKSLQVELFRSLVVSANDLEEGGQGTQGSGVGRSRSQGSAIETFRCVVPSKRLTQQRRVGRKEIRVLGTERYSPRQQAGGATARSAPTG